jgi:hypothetical protein
MRTEAMMVGSQPFDLDICSMVAEGFIILREEVKLTKSCLLHMMSVQDARLPPEPSHSLRSMAAMMVRLLSVEMDV